jgi:hypothetical protein
MSLAECARMALLQAMRELYAVQSHPDVELASTAALLTAHQAAKIVDHDAVSKLSMQLEVRPKQRLWQETFQKLHGVQGTHRPVAQGPVGGRQKHNQCDIWDAGTPARHARLGAVLLLQYIAP